MTPMIDVVFLLIIFFLVSSHMARQENNMELSLPVAASGADDLDQQTPRITVNVTSDGSLWLAGREIATNQLAGLFTTAREQDGNNLEVRIRSSREASYATVEPILLACTEARIWNVTFAVYREERR